MIYVLEGYALKFYFILLHFLVYRTAFILRRRTKYTDFAKLVPSAKMPIFRFLLRASGPQGEALPECINGRITM